MADTRVYCFPIRLGQGKLNSRQMSEVDLGVDPHVSLVLGLHGVEGHCSFETSACLLYIGLVRGLMHDGKAQNAADIQC